MLQTLGRILGKGSIIPGGLIILSSIVHLHIISYTHLYIIAYIHLHIISYTHLYIIAYIHLHIIYTSIHHSIYTSIHQINIYTSYHIYIYTSNIYTYTSCHIHIYTTNIHLYIIFNNITNQIIRSWSGSRTLILSEQQTNGQTKTFCSADMLRCEEEEHRCEASTERWLGSIYLLWCPAPGPVHAGSVAHCHSSLGMKTEAASAEAF